MKMIKITTDNQISVHDFPSGTFKEQNKALRAHIGPQCSIYERVRPKRLYNELHAPNERGNGVSMLIDEEGYYHDLPQNAIGSYLYESDLHGFPILGNILIVGERWEGLDAVFSGINPDYFEVLFPQLRNLVEKARKSL